MDEKRPSKKAAKLTKMAEEEFGKSRKLTHAEHELLKSATTPDVAYGGLIEKDDDPSNDPADAGNWEQDRNIDAGLIRWLCYERSARDLVDPSGIEIHGARIINGLNLTSMVVPFPLTLSRCSIDGEASLYGLEIPLLNLAGSWVGPLNAQGIRVRGSIFLTNHFRADGAVVLPDAQIGGSLDCGGGTFINPQGDALVADGISVGSSIFLNQEFLAQGQVVLQGAQIGEGLVCLGGEFTNPQGIAFNAESISVKGSVFVGSRFEGEVRVLNARIGGDLMCGGGQFTGGVYLIGARCEGSLNCTGADFSKADLWLDGASVRSIIDSHCKWPLREMLHLSGFQYRLAEPEPVDVDAKLHWLQLQPDEPFLPQPYLQLAKVLADAGDDGGRIKVLVAMKDQEWAVRRRGLTAQMWRWPFKVTASYGYRPLQALWEISVLSALGWILYRRSYLAGEVVPTDKDAYEAFKPAGQTPPYYRKFFPLVYSVENSLPLVKLGQGEKWQPDPAPVAPSESAGRKPILDLPARWPNWLRWLQRFLVFVGLRAPEKADAPRSRASRWGTSPRFLRWFLWAQILLGWLLATLFLAGISGIIKKE